MQDNFYFEGLALYISKVKSLQMDYLRTHWYNVHMYDLPVFKHNTIEAWFSGLKAIIGWKKYILETKILTPIWSYISYSPSFDPI